MSNEVPEKATVGEFVDMPAEEMRAYLDSGQEPPALSDAQIASLPPSQIEPYLRARVAAGDAGIFERFKDYIFAGRDAQEIIEKRIHESESAGVEYMEGPPPSDRDYLGEDHATLKSYLDSVAIDNITVHSDAYHEGSQLLQEVADDLKTELAKLQHEWEGAAADNAHGFFTQLSTWAEGNSHNAQLASDIVYQESEAAAHAKNSMPEPVPFSWDEELKKWGGNPFDFGDNVKATFERFGESQRAHEEAARVMATYDGGLHDTGNKQPVFATPPTFGSGAGSDSARMPSGTISIPGRSDSTSASGFSGGVGSSGGVPGGGWTPPPSSPAPGGGYAPAPLPVGRGTGASPTGTRPSGYRPPTVPRSRVPSHRGNPNTMPGMGPVPMGGFGPGGGGGGGGYSSGMGRGAAGGFGPGGGAGAGSGAGAASGAGRPGMPGGMPPAAAPGGAGAAAAAGRGGMGAAGMGAGAGRGKGEDDAEHQRPTYLVEADPDDVFGTDQRTAPPVIGA